MGKQSPLTKQKSRLSKIVKIAGPRYDARVNISLPISFNFDALCRTPAFYKRLMSLDGEVREKAQYLGRGEVRTRAEELYDDFEKKLSSILVHVRAIRKSQAGTEVKWTALIKKCESLRKLTFEIVEVLRNAEKVPGNNAHSDPLQSEINDLYRCSDKIDDLRDFSDENRKNIGNGRIVLITGQAGVGKTHLLCDVATTRLKDGLPTYIFLGEEFTSTNPVDRMVEILGSKNIFNEIDALAKKKGERALILIDAINEAPEKVEWEQLADLRRFKHIGVVLSIRSGFEKAIVKKAFLKTLPIIVHEGFGNLDWLAVTEFFKIFNVPLPKVPIVAPEFRNPLFLKLFCQTYNTKGSFRGCEGSTHLFEAYCKAQGAEVLNALSLPADKSRIWKKIIKPIAQWMAENGQDRILEAKACEVIAAETDFIGREKEILGLLQRHWLLTKVPHYTKLGSISGSEYRFPYQKFSDHLIVRCLLTTHLKKAPKTVKDQRACFLPGTKLGDIVSKSWNYGLIEALSIQVPERLNGIDLVWLVSEDMMQSDPLMEGFLQSLVWRDLRLKKGIAECFDREKALEYINKYLIKSETYFFQLLNTFLGVAGIPEHPFNGRILHGYLDKFSLAKRDRFWQRFLNSHYDEGSFLKRLIDWGWHKESKNYLSDEALELICSTIIWFLASSNRRVRDRSTKALIELLKGREDVLIRLLNQFKSNNDPYIVQRIYAVSLGCAHRSPNTRSLHKLAESVYGLVFSTGHPPADILLRDYAREVIELSNRAKVDLNFDPRKFKPPYGSPWPSRVPSIEVLMKKYRSEETEKMDYSAIWSSVMHGQGESGLADFANYVVNNNLGHFRPYRLNEERAQTEEELLDEFVGLLQGDDLALWETIRKSHVTTFSILNFLDDSQSTTFPTRSEEDLQLEELYQQFVKEFKDKVAITPSYKKYEKVIHKHFSHERLNGHPRFDVKRGQRWIFNKVIQLGWNPEDHNEFDRSAGRSNEMSRDRGVTERIGKKYQWIALHELLALVSDNFAMGGEFRSDPVTPYEGPWQLSVRDVDPTHTLWNVGNSDLEEPVLSDCWWLGARYWKWDVYPSSEAWVKGVDDLPDVKKLIQVKDIDGNEWLNMKGYYTWDEPLPDVDREKRYRLKHKQLWIHVHGYIIHKKDRLEFAKWAKTQDFWNKWMPESHEFHGVYYGEFPHSTAFKSISSPYFGRQEWVHPDPSESKYCPISLMVADDEYSQDGDRDGSVDGGFGIPLPQAYLFREMDLQTDLDNATYLQKKSGEVAFKAPRVKGDGPNLLLANKKLLMKFLKDRDLTIVWTVMGEKMVLGGEVQQIKSCLKLNGAYTMPSDKVLGFLRADYETY